MIYSPVWYIVPLSRPCCGLTLCQGILVRCDVCYKETRTRKAQGNEGTTPGNQKGDQPRRHCIITDITGSEV